MEDFLKIDSIGALHDLLQMPPPQHPLITVLDLSTLNNPVSATAPEGLKVASAFYAITLKQLKKGSLQYGRKNIDFQEGSLFFAAPDQIGQLQHPVFDDCSYNWGLFFHADLLYASGLKSKMAEHSFFRYATNEALHLSDDEKKNLTGIVNGIAAELRRPVDKHTKNVLLSAIELLLNHCQRYYDRQFITRENENHSVVTAINRFLSAYFASSELTEKGLPTAAQCAAHVHLSPNYLSDLLRRETGKTTQEHIHFHLLELAKERLLGSDDSVKEIAYSLGFEYPHYFSNLFKKKNGVSPSQFRNKFEQVDD